MFKHALIWALIAALVSPTTFAQKKLPKEEGMVNLDFHDVDISDVAKSISEITGKNFILDDRTRGKITIISPTPMTVSEAYQFFLAALQMKNLCVVDQGSFTKILPARECKENPIDTEGDEEKVQGDQMITKILSLKHINANEAKQALNTLVSKNGSISAYGPNNALLITDTAANLRRIRQILDKLDREGYQATVEMIPMKYAQASDIAEKLNVIFDADKGRSRSVRRGSDVEGGSDIQKIMPDARTNSLIVVATKEGLERTLDLLAELDRPVEVRMDQNHVHVRPLKHADATELAGLLSSLISGTQPAKKKKEEKSKSSVAPTTPGTYPPQGTEMANPWDEQESVSPASSETGAIVQKAGGMFQDEVRVVPDPSTNSLVITASPTDYATLEPVIDQLDKRRSQVFVEALIMEVNISKGLQVGLSGHNGTATKNNLQILGASHLGGLTPAVVSQSPGMLADPKNPLGLILGGTSNSTFKIKGVELPMSGALFHALQTNDIINVLSAPNILTTDNKKAEIVIGDKIPFKSSDSVIQGGYNQVTYNREDVGIKLFVTPKIADSNEVTLDVEQHIQEVRNKGEAVDIQTSERSVKTTVVAENGQTIVIGGLIKDKDTKSVNKVPLLGDIPLVGYLFRENNVSHEKLNLVLFLTPHIIHDPLDLSRVSIATNNKRRRFNKRHGIGENQALYDYGLDEDLNMAPPAPKKTEEIEKPKKKFNYDAEPDSGSPTSTTQGDEVQLSSRQPKRKAPRVIDYANNDDSGSDSASTEVRRDRKKSSPSNPANPFSDVRPPSSTP